MTEPSLSLFEKRLADEVAKIDARIKALEIEKQTLLRQITKARSERTGLANVTRKNSLHRAIAEHSVIDFIRQAKRPCATRVLYRNARLTNFDLKETTFRTYLHRMKKKGIIKTQGHVGVWALVEKP